MAKLSKGTRHAFSRPPPPIILESGHDSGFTLIELSIVLVIIGLIVGGVLVGQDLIRAAAVRATISQIEKYNTAVNTFRGKYSALPGDLNQQVASAFGFAARGQYAGEGDGNGIIEGVIANGSGPGLNWGDAESTGETVMFWVDLSAVNLIDGKFTTATPTTLPASSITGTTLNAYFPPAKLGAGNYFYVYSNNSINYFGLSAPTVVTTTGGFSSTPNLTALQAYLIDKKIDDGLPESGSIIAQSVNDNYIQFVGTWPTDPSATPGSASTCYDNSSATSGTPGIYGATQHYSLEINSGAGVNCALSFPFQ